ncbi:MAG: thiamine diphosphokinase [Elusimicrobiota bacterium]|jgi:thiamine pyrophosphokinase|nr:thiamine diphosphokinase [Elusimicrobiota bacterium]
MRKIENILIIANGAKEPSDFLRALAEKNDFTLALDGGADTALCSKITPDLAIGDLDSISAAAKKKLGEIKLFKITRQDNTDFEKSLDFCSFIKPQSVTVVCATGGRVDFTLGNLFSAFNYIKKFNIVFEGFGWRVYPIEKTRQFTCNKGCAVSLMSIDSCSGITLKNLKYPLKNASLNPGQAAVSNVALENNFTVLLKSGKLLITVYDKKPPAINPCRFLL